MSEQLRQAALDFHEFPIPGKIEVTPTKSLATQRDLALAYSPGVAEPCLEIEKDPSTASRYTARGNLQIYGAWKFSGGDFQWYSGTWSWQYWRACGQTCNGREGRIVQKICGYQRI